MKYTIEITVPKDREHELALLAGIASSEFALAVGQVVAPPARRFYERFGESDSPGEVLVQLAFDDVESTLSVADAALLQTKVEGGKSRRSKRCRATVLVVRVIEQLGGIPAPSPERS